MSLALKPFKKLFKDRTEFGSIPENGRKVYYGYNDFNIDICVYT